MQHLVISFITQDRQGIVKELSTVIKQYQGNWQVSSLHKIGHVFAGIIDIEVSKEQTEDLDKALKQLSHLKLHTMLAAPEQTIGNKPVVTLEITANDRVGIIQDVTTIVQQNGGNLLKLVSRQEAAPHTGQMMFMAKLTIEIQPEQQSSLVAALEQLTDDLMVDITPWV
jgi:glycine cleavage system regulatory protein